MFQAFCGRHRQAELFDRKAVVLAARKNLRFLGAAWIMGAALLPVAIRPAHSARRIQAGEQRSGERSEERNNRGAAHTRAHSNDASENAGRNPVICIDPGHSRQTVGASANHLQEYKVCWQMAKQLQLALQAEGDTVILTKRTQDENVTNEERARIANRSHADLLIRLHCDSGGDAGIATFYPATQGEIRGVRGPSDDVIAHSRRAARSFHAALIRAIAARSIPLRDRGVRTDAQTYVGGKLGGALEGSIFSECPVLLVEMCVLDNAANASFIRDKSNQAALAQAMAAGVQAAVRQDK